MFANLDAMTFVTFLLILFMSVAIHETMHALVAYKLGDDLAHSKGRISLNPLKHIDPLLTIFLPAVMMLVGMAPILAAKPVPINTSRISGGDMGLAAVGLAGPLTNLVLATIAALSYKFMDPGALYDFVRLFIQLNVALFVFNMMPIPPLDGSRLLYAFAPPSVQRIMEQIEQAGMIMIIVLLTVLLPLISPILTVANRFVLNILIG